MANGAPGKNRRKRKQNPNGGYIKANRTLPLLLKDNVLTLSGLGAYLTILIHSTWDYEFPEIRYPRSASKMAEIAGGNRTNWHKHLTKLKTIKLIVADEYGDDILPYFDDDYDSAKAGSSKSQQTDEIKKQFNAIQQNDVSMFQHSATPVQSTNTHNNDLTKDLNNNIVAISQQPKDSVETSKETLQETTLVHSQVATEKRQQPDQKMVCDNCDTILQGIDITWAVHHKLSICKSCRNDST